MGETATDLGLPTAEADVRMLAAALAGDSTAMIELARKLTPPIQVRVARALARRAGRRVDDLKSDLDDLTQEVFVRLFAHDARALRAWDPARGLSLVSFVGMVAEREVSNVFKSRRRAPWNEKMQPTEDMESFSIDLGGEERVIYRDLLLKLCRKLETWLTPRGRELFDEVYLEERPLQEVADKFGMKPSALYAWRNRVGKQARDLLDELQSEAEGTSR